MTKQYLTQAYDLDGPEATKKLYENWAQSYDEEVTANGYSSPLRTAQALVASGAKLDEAVLDIGCGSGLSGLFLKKHGFKKLHGSDFSQDMLDLAVEKDVYAELHHADLTEPFAFVKTQYHTVTAIGVMAPGHAEPELIHTALTLMKTGGLFGFSLNDHTLKNAGYLSEINQLLMDKQVRIRWQDYGDHLPNIGLNSMIVVLEKL